MIDTTPAIKKFFSSSGPSGLHEFNKNALVIIMSDSDAAFRGDNRDEDQKFQKILSNNAVLEPVILNNHHALGVFDNFAKNLKRVLSKEFLENKSTEWISILPKIIEQYNNTPHTSLDNITPNDAISDLGFRV